MIAIRAAERARPLGAGLARGVPVQAPVPRLDIGARQPHGRLVRRGIGNSGGRAARRRPRQRHKAGGAQAERSPLPATYAITGPANLSVSYIKQYLVTYLGPIWRNQTWVNAGASMTFNPPRAVYLGNGTRLVEPLVNGTAPPLSISVDRPLSLFVEYARQYLVSVRTPFGGSSVWVNASASYAPPASAVSTDGVRLAPSHLSIDGRRTPLGPVPVDAPMNLTVHYNAYAEVPTSFAGLPALYADASITCGGASNSTSGLFAYSLELADVPAGRCSTSVREIPSPVLAAAAAAAAALAVALIRRPLIPRPSIGRKA